jgi:hypothetical protein
LIAPSIMDVMLLKRFHEICKRDIVSVFSGTLLRGNHRWNLTRENLLHKRLRRSIVAAVVSDLEERSTVNEGTGGGVIEYPFPGSPLSVTGKQ